jgi:hypothetical protein
MIHPLVAVVSKSQRLAQKNCQRNLGKETAVCPIHPLHSIDLAVTRIVKKLHAQ